ncbi:hypothetical protein D081_0255 [Anaerovibrio sp. JC8]|nr:hypothetical protein D081_0255 [Anaerovibrio sp. JC8]
MICVTTIVDLKNVKDLIVVYKAFERVFHGECEVLYEF